MMMPMSGCSTMVTEGWLRSFLGRRKLSAVSLHAQQTCRQLNPNAFFQQLPDTQGEQVELTLMTFLPTTLLMYYLLRVKIFTKFIAKTALTLISVEI